jgi:hypothetical protein
MHYRSLVWHIEVGPDSFGGAVRQVSSTNSPGVTHFGPTFARIEMRRHELVMSAAQDADRRIRAGRSNHPAVLPGLSPRENKAFERGSK